MGGGFGLQVLGDIEVARSLDRMGSQARKYADPAVNVVAEDVADEANANAPEGPTGDLGGSYEATKVADGVYDVGSDIRYAPFVEKGTYKDAPQPHLYPAADRNADRLVEEIADAIERSFG